MSRTLVYFFYNLFLPLVLLFGLPRYLVKGMKRGGMGRNFRQRFGALPPAIDQLETRPIWIHAVSVGEVLVAAKIIRALRRKVPDKAVVFSTTTSTGFGVAEKELGQDPGIIVIHNPVDLPWVVRRVVSRINPEKLILVESEIWPNLVGCLKKRGIPVLLANARLSVKSESRYRKFISLIAPIFSEIDRTSVPFIADVERWAALGIRRDTITVLGSVKFDESAGGNLDEKIGELKAWLRDGGWDDRQPVFLAGSTHLGEEKIACQVWQELRVKHPNLALVIVPRHAERAPDFKPELENLGTAVWLRSVQQGTADHATGYDGTSKNRVFVSDTTGELRAWFHIADVVFIGKSLTGRGGQNPIEPVLAGKPVIVGPHMENFYEVTSDLVARGGMIQVSDAEGLREAADRLLSEPELGKKQAETGKIALKSHHGAAERTADWILKGTCPEDYPT